MTHSNDIDQSTPRNLLITGIPRSGTTLTCWLINQLPNAIALSEPMDVSKLTQTQDSVASLRQVGDFLAEVRDLALKHQPLPGKVIRGGGSNSFPSVVGGRRRSLVMPSANVKVNKVLNANFLLAVKHPNSFAALLPVLVRRFPCCATIRNPLSVLASWETVEAPVHEGHAPFAEAVDENLRTELAGLPTLIDRQVTLLDWYYRKFAATLHQDRILRYEDVITTNGTALSSIVPAATNLPAMLAHPLESQNQNPIYENGSYIRRCAETLLEMEDHGCWRYYKKEEIVQVLEATKDRFR